MKRLAFFVSGGGTNMQALLDGIKAGEIVAEPALVVCSRAGIGAIERAKKAGIDYIVEKDWQQLGFASKDEYVLSVLKEKKIDILLLAGYLSVVSPLIVEKYRQKILNIHPALIPAFCGKGYYGMHVHNAVYQAGVKVTGATVHFVDEGVDSGAIIIQAVYQIKPTDSADDIQKGVLKLEHKIYPEALKALVEERIRFEDNRAFII